MARTSAFGLEPLSEPHGIDQRKLGLVEEVPALAEEPGVRLDQHGLDRHAGMPGDQGEAALQRIDRRGYRPGSFGEDQELVPVPDLAGGRFHQRRRRVVADIARHPGAAAEEQVVVDIGLGDADRPGQVGEHEHRIEQGRMVGADHQPALAPQRIERAEIAFQDAASLHGIQVSAETEADHEAAEGTPVSARQDRVQHGRRQVPRQTHDAEKQQQPVEQDVFPDDADRPGRTGGCPAGPLSRAVPHGHVTSPAATRTLRRRRNHARTLAFRSSAALM